MLSKYVLFSCCEVLSSKTFVANSIAADNEEELFNPNCVTANLLDNLRRRCGCQKGGRNIHCLFKHF